MPTETATPIPSSSPTPSPKPTASPKPTPKPKAWTAAYRASVCLAIDDLYDITPHLDAVASAIGNLDYASARSQAFEIVSLALEAQAETVGLDWSPGEALVATIKRAGDSLGSGAATFIDGLDAMDTDEMRAGALQMDAGGSEVTAAQSEFDRLASKYHGSCP